MSDTSHSEQAVAVPLADPVIAGTAPSPTPPTPPTPSLSTGARVRPVLNQLATHYPKLFGEAPLPLKRGIFEDVLAAHPDLCDKETLKHALGWHTRSTRYLQAVAHAQPRHDLQGQAVEAMAPEHVFHALLEVFKRQQQRQTQGQGPARAQGAGQPSASAPPMRHHPKHGRGNPDPMSVLRKRMIRAFEASGLSAQDYAARVHGRDENINTQLAQALSEYTQNAARDEALLRAFEGSGQTEAEFAQMYGMSTPDVSRRLLRARKIKA